MPKLIILFLSAGLFSGTLLLTGCFSSQSYQADRIEQKVLISRPTERAQHYQGVLRNPVIVIHGLLGSRLTDRKTGKNVWGEFSAVKIEDPAHWQQLALPMKWNAPLKDLKNSIEHGAILEKSTMQVLGMGFNLGNYDKMVAVLEKYGYVRDDIPLPKGKLFPSLFLFDYDWRRDISENTKHLDEYIREKRLMLQKRYEELCGVKNYDVRFDIVAHSMGGLLTRYYIQYGGNPLPEDGSLPRPSDAGSRLLEKILIVGTPNAGFLDTLLEMTGGLQLSPVVKPYPPAVLGTFASYYFMMPHNEGRHVIWSDAPNGAPVDIYDPGIWIAMKWGLADPKQDSVLQAILPQAETPEIRRKIALDHLRKNLKRARQFTNAMRVPLEKKENLVLLLFAGDAFETNRTAELDRQTGKLKVIRTEAGDGKILSTSVRFDLRDQGSDSIFLQSPIPWDGVYYFGASHMGLLSGSDFDTNLSYNLLNRGTPRQMKLKDLEPIRKGIHE